MCGICGWIGRSTTAAAEPATIRRMNATLAHRGPDEAGAALFANGSVAMSRLSIIDLSSGHQPIANEDFTRWIVFNGEIYNFQELREELTALGHRFRTRSDTETILHGYEQWGPDCVRRLRGMFAFCIAETTPEGEIEQAFFARDRVGKKPLFYAARNGELVFGSEIKAILEHPDIAREPDESVLPEYLTYGYAPAPRTAFRGVSELPPAHTMMWRRGELRIDRYWDIDHRNEFASSNETELSRELLARLDEAVRVRLVSEVPLGAFLSGGVDSTAIVALMARHSSRPVKTFAIGFEGEKDFNELGYARMAAKEYGTDHHEFVVEPRTIDLLPKLVWHHDQPFSDNSAIPTYLVSELTRQHVTVCLTGDGGDELFAGYERFVAARLAGAYRRWPQGLRSGLQSLLGVLPESTGYYGFVRRARRFVKNAALPLDERYLGWANVFNREQRNAILAIPEERPVEEHVAAEFARAGGLDAITQLLYVHAKTCLPGDLLVKTDRMTMAASLEARSPLLDHHLFEFAARIPAALKLKGLTTKHILKRSLEGLVPRRILHRKKHGFSVPVGAWFRGDLRDYAREILLGGGAQSRGRLNLGVVERMLEEHQSGRRDRSLQIWTLLTYEIWHQVFIDRSWQPAMGEAPELRIDADLRGGTSACSCVAGGAASR